MPFEPASIRKPVIKNSLLMMMITVQAAILAVGAIVKKPVVNDKNEIVVGERMNISLSGDHRVVDGAVGAAFLASLRRLVENPALMLF